MRLRVTLIHALCSIQYTGIVSIVICILYLSSTQSSLGKVTLGRPQSVPIRSQISVVQVIQPLSQSQPVKCLTSRVRLTCAAVILICLSHRLVNNDPVSSVS